MWAIRSPFPRYCAVAPRSKGEENCFQSDHEPDLRYFIHQADMWMVAAA
jgi:hypothetical protein